MLTKTWTVLIIYYYQVFCHDMKKKLNIFRGIREGKLLSLQFLWKKAQKRHKCGLKVTKCPENLFVEAEQCLLALSFWVVNAQQCFADIYYHWTQGCSLPCVQPKAFFKVQISAWGHGSSCDQSFTIKNLYFGS